MIIIARCDKGQFKQDLFLEWILIPTSTVTNQYMLVRPIALMIDSGREMIRKQAHRSS